MINAVAGSISNSIFFYVYADGKKKYNFDSNHPYSWKTIIISLRSGLVAMAITAPLWTLKTRLILYRETHKYSVSHSIVYKRIV